MGARVVISEANQDELLVVLVPVLFDGRPEESAPGATHPNKAMIARTHGNGNADPKIPSLPAGTIN